MKALLIVDVQNDFMPWGSLPVPQGDIIIAYINELMKDFDIIVATQDFHPRNHVSFAANHPGKSVGDVVKKQRLWPVHCVQGEKGADFAPTLDVRPIGLILRKGMHSECDSYSAFFDETRTTTGLSGYLKALNVKEVHVVGVATDVCVYFSVLDALSEGFHVFVHKRGCQGLEGADKALTQMQAQGATLC